MQLIISPLWTVIVTVLHLAVGQVEALVGGGGAGVNGLPQKRRFNVTT